MRKPSFFHFATLCSLAAALSLASSLAAQDCDGVPSVNTSSVTAQLISDALSRPVDVATPAGDLERIFVVEQAGRIRIISLADNALQPAGDAFLDIEARVVDGGERGLLGLAFHPQFETNGYFFVNYTRGAGAVCSASEIRVDT